MRLRELPADLGDAHRRAELLPPVASRHERLEGFLQLSLGDAHLPLSQRGRGEQT